MAVATRSPFGELLARHRRHLGISQQELAARTDALAHTDPGVRAVSERAINGLERRHADASHWRLPRPATVRALARALGIAPDAPDYAALVAAAASPSPVGEFIEAGRESHLERLKSLIERAASGEPALALVGAEAGAGKTWLVREACEQALSRHDTLVVLWTECVSRFDPAPSHEPLRRMARLMLGELPLVPPTATLAHANAQEVLRRVPVTAGAFSNPVAALIDTLVPSEVLRRATVDGATRKAVDIAIARHAGQGGQPDPGAIAALIAAYAEAGPAVMVVEDLQRADAGTQAALVAIVEALARKKAPVALIGTWRIGEDAAASDGTDLDTLLSTLRGAFPDADIDLSTAIGGDAGRRFIDAALSRRDAPTDAPGDLLFARTAGLPLFVMSYLRLHDRIAATDPSRALEEIATTVPDDVRTVFMQQLYNLPPEAQTLLSAASVQGDMFLAEPIMDLLALSPERFEDLVDGDLAARYRMLAPANAVEIAGQRARRYRFTHSLLRDTLYTRMTPLHRAWLHEQTAAALSNRFGETGHDALEAIAMHREHAGTTLEAARAYLVAGDRAMEQGDHERAARLYAKIHDLDVLALDPALHVQAIVGLGNCARGLGDQAATIARLTEARDLANALGLHAIHANALTSLGMVDFDRGAMEDAVSRLTAAITAYERAGDRTEAARATANLGFALHGLGAYDAARDASRRAIAAAAACDDPTVMAAARTADANVLMDLGRFEEAIAAHAETLAHCDAHGLLYRGNISLMNIALCQIELERHDDARATIARMLRPERAPISRIMAVAEFNAALIAEDEGRWAEAAERFEAARAIRARIGLTGLVVDALAGMLRTAIAVRDAARARDLSMEIERRLARDGMGGVEHTARLYLARIDAATMLGDDATARHLLDEGVAWLEHRAEGLRDPNDRASWRASPRAHRELFRRAGRL